MSIDKLLRIKIWSKVLLIISVVLFLIGIGVIFGPALIHVSAMNQDAVEAWETREETKAETPCAGVFGTERGNQDRNLCRFQSDGR